MLLQEDTDGRECDTEPYYPDASAGAGMVNRAFRERGTTRRSRRRKTRGTSGPPSVGRPTILSGWRLGGEPRLERCTGLVLALCYFVTLMFADDTWPDAPTASVTVSTTLYPRFGLTFV